MNSGFCTMYSDIVETEKEENEATGSPVVYFERKTVSGRQYNNVIFH